MSMFISQCDELREAAGRLEGYQNGEISRMLREAADTIERLRKQVAKCQIAELKADYDTSRYFELFGTPEMAARTLRRFCADCFCGDCATCGVPEWASYSHDCDALLEWLRGDA